MDNHIGNAFRLLRCDFHIIEQIQHTELIFNMLNIKRQFQPLQVPFMKQLNIAGSPPEVGATLQKIRLSRGLTLEDLSRAAGVSKSMLSQIEREKANPTIAVAWRLANALGIGIEELLAGDNRNTEAIHVLEPHETPTLPGNHAGYVLRILGPMELAGKYEWYELTLAPEGALVSNPHDPGTMEYLTLLNGTVEVDVNGLKKKLKAGGTARYQADKSHAIRNQGKSEARALLVVVHR